jgi:nicotinamide mononucleotide (NMN) deamidase PncC
MVCFAWALKKRATESTVRCFRGNREGIRRQSVAFALRGLLDRLEERK